MRPALEELAIALRSQAADLAEADLAADRDDVRSRAAEIEALHRDPTSPALCCRLGVDGEFADQDRRRREIANFLESLGELRTGSGA
ncbi:hypothetical protein [Rubellimicrobium roseum]|uniref:Uncharacterized protein n=1 Tax=Rubellimicrobium roseum TaxID=687525 RepID=A0A5C4N8W9_9RHOB|nr:hypothetical protein [Rubellimicrobium roseum]TNC62067.1 hypothetical protein FHG71_20525 [Rubellimicrobium roseum]